MLGRSKSLSEPTLIQAWQVLGSLRVIMPMDAGEGKTELRGWCGCTCWVTPLEYIAFRQAGRQRRWGQHLSVILMARSHSTELRVRHQGHLLQLCDWEPDVHFLGTYSVPGTGSPGLTPTQPGPLELMGQQSDWIH